jgi:hypothetical protein
MAEGNVMTGAGRGPVPSRAPQSRSVPVGLDIPAIGVSVGVVPIGLRPDHTLEAARGDAPAGWYERSPTPGEPGTAVIIGPAEALNDCPAVFHQLRLLRPGDRITVHRADGVAICFAVTAVGLHPRDAFPGELTPAAGSHPELVLITRAGSHPVNLAVFARALD